MLLKELRHEVFAAFNGAGDKLRKKRNEQRVDAKVLLYFDIAAVYVYYIRKALEGIKRYTDREDDIQRAGMDRYADQRERLRNRLGKEVKVFEEEQYQQRYGNADGKNPFACAIGAGGVGEQSCGKIGLQRDTGDQDDQLRIPAHVEIVAGDEQQNPAEPMRQRKIGEENNDEEDSELPGVKQHNKSFRRM